MRLQTLRRIIQAVGLAGIVGASLAVSACGAWPTAPSYQPLSQPTLSQADVASFATPGNSATSLFLFTPLASSLLRAHVFNARNVSCVGGGVTGIASSFDGALPDSGSGQISMNAQMTFTNCLWNGAVLQGDPNITLSGQLNYVNSLAVTPFTISLTSGVTFTYRNAPGKLQYNCTGTIDGDTSRFKIIFSGTITIQYPIGTAETTVPCADSQRTTGTSQVTVAPSPASIAIVGNTTFAAIGLTSQLSAKVTFSNGNVQTVENQATWTTSNAAVVTVSSGGLLTTVGSGEADIQATYHGATDRDISGTARVTISPELSQHACSEEPSLKSLQAPTVTSIQFINASSTPRAVFWLDYSGQRQLYKNLDPNTSYIQSTFLTHPWLVTGASNNCLAIYLPALGLGTAVLR